MYKAIKEIGGYKIGDEIPTEQALVWISMYAMQHIEEVSGKSTEKVEEVEIKESEIEKPSNSILEDYLARGISVVKKNVAEDELSEEQLLELLVLEESGKNRYAVITAINKRLDN